MDNYNLNLWHHFKRAEAVVYSFTGIENAFVKCLSSLSTAAE